MTDFLELKKQLQEKLREGRSGVAEAQEILEKMGKSDEVEELQKIWLALYDFSSEVLKQ